MSFPGRPLENRAAPVTGAEHEIRRRISESGQITFAEFMELALYHSDGYYAARRNIGAEGDYFTSPVAHPAFSALIAVQLRQMWETLERPNPFQIVEMGAGDGTLARDFLDFAEDQLEDFASAIRYLAIDRFPPESPDKRVQWIEDTKISLGEIEGCLLSNELPDAFPVHRFRIEDGRVREIYVTVDPNGSFAERFGEPSTPLIEQRLSSLPRTLGEGFQGEVNLGIRPWMQSVASSLERGYVLTIDYGYEADVLYSDDRNRGTFQTYYRHVDGSSPYQRVGRQDMTAHVDFSALIDEGRHAGLRPVFLTTQTEFLRSLGFDQLRVSFDERDLDRSKKIENLRAMNELVEPDGLGKFNVLVQEKNSGIRRSSDLVPMPTSLDGLEAPLMGSRHIQQPDSKHNEFNFDLNELWPSEDR